METMFPIPRYCLSQSWSPGSFRCLVFVERYASIIDHIMLRVDYASRIMSVIITTTFGTSCLCLPCNPCKFSIFRYSSLVWFFFFFPLLIFKCINASAELAFIPVSSLGDLGHLSGCRAQGIFASWPSSRLSESWLFKMRMMRPPRCGTLPPPSGSWRWRSKNIKNCLALPRQTWKQKGRTWVVCRFEICIDCIAYRDPWFQVGMMRQSCKLIDWSKTSGANGIPSIANSSFIGLRWNLKVDAVLSSNKCSCWCAPAGNCSAGWIGS